jgi:hypothetical protein
VQAAGFLIVRLFSFLLFLIFLLLLFLMCNLMCESSSHLPAPASTCYSRR